MYFACVVYPFLSFPLSPPCSTEQSAFNVPLCEADPFTHLNKCLCWLAHPQRMAANSLTPSAHFLMAVSAVLRA